MAVILAVEPDRQRGRQLTSLVRRCTSAEIVVAQSGSAALTAIGTGIPDLILTPAGLAAHDEAVLRTWLRRLGDAAAHVQTLTIPLELDSTTRDAGSIFGRLLERREVADDGEAARFGEQVAAALDCASAQRASAATRVWEQELGLDRDPSSSPALWRVSEGLPDDPQPDADGWSRIDPSLPRFRALLERLAALAAR